MSCDGRQVSPPLKVNQTVPDAGLADAPAGIERPAMAAGIDALRSALALLRDIETGTPPGDRRDAVAAALAEADKQIKIAEAQIAQGLGYALCQCAFPPTPMLHVGDFRGATGQRMPVRECPRCKRHDGPINDSEWTRRTPWTR